MPAVEIPFCILLFSFDFHLLLKQPSNIIFSTDKKGFVKGGIMKIRTLRLTLSLAAFLSWRISSQAQWVQTNRPYDGIIYCFAESPAADGSGTNLFAGTDDGVFLSTDNGTSWIKVNNGLTSTNVRAFAISGMNLFAGTYGGVFLFTNNGTSWTDVSTGLTSLWVTSFAISGSNLFAGTNSGVYLSTDNGTSWSDVNAGMVDPHANTFAFIDTNLFAGTSLNGVLLSADNGTNWTYVNNGLKHTNVRVLTVCGSDLYAGTDSGGVFLSNNNGKSWTDVSIGLTNANVNALVVKSAEDGSGTSLFAGAGGGIWSEVRGGIFLSTNNGTSWTKIKTGLNVTALAVMGKNLFAGTWWGNGVYLSTDNGTSWAEVNNGLPAPYVNDLAVIGTNLFAGVWSYSPPPGGVFLSTNNGEKWEHVGLESTIVPPFVVIGTNLFVGDWNGGVFFTADNGTSWTAVNTGLNATTIDALGRNGSYLFASTGNGIWRRPLSEMITSVEEPPSERSIPENFSLEQNYPNPFNPTTSIQFHLPASSFVTLKVYNSAGREVATLVDRQLPAGSHRTEWNASSVPSGIYYYRIQAGNHMETKKLVVMR